MSSVFAAGQSLKSSSIPKQLLQNPLGPMDPDKKLYLVISLPVRDKAQLDRFLQDLYDPQSPDYRHYLTPQEFAQRFAMTQADYNVVTAFFKNQGFEVKTSPSRRLLDIDGSVKTIESTFHVSLNLYNDTIGHRTFYASDKTPSVDLNIPLLNVTGLDNYTKFRPLRP